MLTQPSTQTWSPCHRTLRQHFLVPARVRVSAMERPRRVCVSRCRRAWRHPNAAWFLSPYDARVRDIRGYFAFTVAGRYLVRRDFRVGSSAGQFLWQLDHTRYQPPVQGCAGTAGSSPIFAPHKAIRVRFFNGSVSVLPADQLPIRAVRRRRSVEPPGARRHAGRCPRRAIDLKSTNWFVPSAASSGACKQVDPFAQSA